MASGKRKQKGMSAGRMAMLVIVIGLLIGIAFIVKNIIGLTIEKRELTEKHEELSNKRDELTAELENVNDLDYIEEQARKLLHMIKPGEILYILDGSGNPDANAEGNGIELPDAPVITPEPETSETEEPYSEEESSGTEEWNSGEENSEATWEESSESTWEESTETTWEEAPAESGEEGDWDSGDEGSDG